MSSLTQAIDPNPAPEETMPLFIVDAVIVTKVQYAIRAKSLEHAYDTAVCQDATAFEIKSVGETILGGREATEAQYLAESAQSENSGFLDQADRLALIHQVVYAQKPSDSGEGEASASARRAPGP